jgi:hypothetical protein
MCALKVENTKNWHDYKVSPLSTFHFAHYLPVYLALTPSASHHAENIGRCTDGRTQMKVQKHGKDRTELKEQETYNKKNMAQRME